MISLERNRRRMTWNRLVSAAVSRLGIVIAILVGLSAQPNRTIAQTSLADLKLPEQRKASNQSRLRTEFLDRVIGFTTQFRDYEFGSYVRLGESHLLCEKFFNDNPPKGVPESEDVYYEVFVIDSGPKDGTFRRTKWLTFFWAPGENYAGSMFDGNDTWKISSPRSGMIETYSDFIIIREQWDQPPENWREPTKGNACWHEANHAALLAGLGDIGEPAEHRHIEGYGERGRNLLQGQLCPVEEAIEQANRVTLRYGRPLSDDEQQRVWSPVRTKWLNFLGVWADFLRTSGLSSEERANYRRICGVFLEDAPKVVEQYRQGKYRRKSGIVPPAWVFQEPGVLDTIVRCSDVEAPKLIGDEARYMVTVRPLAPVESTLNMLRRGKLRVYLVESAAAVDVALEVFDAKETRQILSGAPEHLIDLSDTRFVGEDQLALIVQVKDPVAVEKLGLTEVHVALAYSDPELKYSPSGNKLTFPIYLRHPKPVLRIAGDERGQVAKPVAVNAKLTSPAGPVTVPRDAVYIWKVDGVRQTGEGAMMSFTPTQPGVAKIELEIRLYRPEEDKLIATASASIPIDPDPTTIPTPPPIASPSATAPSAPRPSTRLGFAGTAPDIWKGGTTVEGFELARTTATSGPGRPSCTWGAQINAKVTGTIMPPFAPRNQAELDKRIDEAKKSAKTIRPWTIGDYRGFIADIDVQFRPGSGGMGGYTGSQIMTRGYGFAFDPNGQTISIHYFAGGAGCWDDCNRPFLESMTSVAIAEAKSIVAGLQLIPGGQFGKSPYQGPKLDGSDLPRVVLVPAQLPKLKVGESARVRVTVENARPEDSPFRFQWSGAHEGQPADLSQADAVTVRPRKAGKYPLAVAVSGARGLLGSASLEYEVAEVKAIVQQTPPLKRPFVVGAPIGFQALATIDGAPLGGGYRYRWQPDPEVTFDKLDSQEADVVAIFNKPGRVTLWVQILDDSQGELQTLVESSPLELEIVKPSFQIQWEPQEPYVGQLVKARIVGTPEPQEASYRWLPLGDDARQLSQSQDDREITFYLKNERPVELKVLVLASKSGDDLGEAEETIRAKKYVVRVVGPQSKGPKPRVWKEGLGLVEVDQAVVVGQEVSFSAYLSPEAFSGPLKYQWTESGPCRVSNPTSQQAQVVASSPGACEVSVAVAVQSPPSAMEGQAMEIVDRLPPGIISEADLDRFLEQNAATIDAVLRAAVRSAFLARRELRIKELQSLLKQLESTSLELRSDPTTPIIASPDAASVSVKIKPVDEPVETTLAGLRNLARRLTGNTLKITVQDRWSGIDPVRQSDWPETREQTFEFTKSGNYTLELIRTITLEASSASAELTALLNRRTAIGGRIVLDLKYKETR